MKDQMENIEEASVLPLYKYCEELEIEHDKRNPKDMINKIIRSLRTKSNQHYLFVCDEVPACHDGGQETADWSDLETAENVTWVLAIRPDGTENMQNLAPPSGPSIISRKLLHSHRNSYKIRSVSLY